MRSLLYDTLIMIVLIMKLTYVFIAMIDAYAQTRWDKKSRETIRALKEDSLATSEVFMYLVLVIIFFPKKSAEDIRVGREEQLIFFILGLLGIIHTNWHHFSDFFLHTGDVIFGK